MIDLILLDPPISTKVRFGKLAKVGSVLPSLALATLASVARKHRLLVQIIDGNISSLTIAQLVNLMVSQNPRWIGITATTLTIDIVGKIAKMIKNKNKKIIVIVGGAHMTASPKETMEKYKAIDIGVVGEGEITFSEILQEKNLRNIKGIIYRKGNNLFQNINREYIKDLDILELPAWNLIDGFPKKYKPSANSFKKLPATHLVTSRGCTGQCIFCDRSTFGRVPRIYSANKVIQMIKILTGQYGIKEIQFFDDNFALFPKRLEKICDFLQKEELSWSCQVRADMINLRLLKLMKKAGCWQIGLGVESGSDNILSILKKNETSSLLNETIKMISTTGIEVKGFFILGNPGETIETLKKTEEFIMRSKLSYAHTTFFTPYPGCEAYHNIEKYGQFKFKYDWSKIGQGTIRPIFIPNGLTEKDLKNFAMKISRRFYFRPKIIYYQLIQTIKNPIRIKSLIDAFLPLFK